MELNLYSDQENSNCVQSLPPIVSFSSMLNEHQENEQLQFWQPMSQIEFQPNSGYLPSWNHFQVYSSYEDQMIELVPINENRAVQQISNSKRSKEKRTASINSGIEIMEESWIFFFVLAQFNHFQHTISSEATFQTCQQKQNYPKSRLSNMQRATSNTWWTFWRMKKRLQKNFVHLIRKQLFC